MNLLEDILSSNDDDLSFLTYPEEKKNVTVSKRKREDLEEGELEEGELEEGELQKVPNVCVGYFFDISYMKIVSGCVECNNGRYCSRPRRL